MDPWSRGHGQVITYIVKMFHNVGQRLGPGLQLCFTSRASSGQLVASAWSTLFIHSLNKHLSFIAPYVPGVVGQTTVIY